MTPASPFPTISRVGLGAWAFSGVGWGPQDDSDSVAAIHRAVELGCDWIDTAAVYGNGHSEQVVGRALASLPARERPLVFTKCGVRVDVRTQKTYRDLRPQSVREECELSLQRLGVERLDLLQLHWPVAELETVLSAWETLGDLQREGVIRWAGVSNFDVPLMTACARLRPIDAVQAPLSLLARQAAADVLPWAAANDAAVIVYSPLESGLLSGRFSRERAACLPADDWRRRRPQFRQPELDHTLALVDRLAPIAQRAEASLVELAIAWTLAWPAVTGAIAGARNAAQVDGWASSGVALTQATLADVAAAIVATGAGEGPDQPS